MAVLYANFSYQINVLYGEILLFTEDKSLPLYMLINYSHYIVYIPHLSGFIAFKLNEKVVTGLLNP